MRFPRSIRPPVERSATPTVALLPGSRRAELARHLPALVAAVDRLRSSGTAHAFIVPLADPELRSTVEAATASRPVTIVDGPRAARTAVGQAHGALVATGTATLETALLGCPQVAYYRLHPLTYAVARRVITTRYWALPNVLVDDSAIPEYIQEAATGPALAEALAAQMSTGPGPALALADRVRSRLGSGGAAERAAAAVMGLVKGRHR